MTRSSKTSLTPQQIKRYRERLQGENFRPFLSKPWQQERAIRKLAADGSEEAAASLADGVVSDCFCHRSLRIQALAELTQLSSQLQSATSIDALCRYWIESEEPEESLTNLLLVAGYAPSKPAERALFWLLSGQIQRYEDLDLDGTLLTQAHAKASPGLRKRLATAAAAEGRVEWLGAMEVAKTLNTFSEDNWSTTVQLLTQAGAVKALWERGPEGTTYSQPHAVEGDSSWNATTGRIRGSCGWASASRQSASRCGRAEPACSRTFQPHPFRQYR